MNFVAVDVETASADLSSICQIGVAVFQDGALSRGWESLIDPEDHFDPINVSIHGIDEETVRHAPTWETAFPVVNLSARAIDETAQDSDAWIITLNQQMTNFRTAI